MNSPAPDYFDIAANLARSHEAERRAAAAKHAKQKNLCHCEVYRFPHRAGSCEKELAYLARISDPQTKAEQDREESILMDRAAASAINSGAW